MVLVQILKRKDASSIIVAVVGALVIVNTLQTLTQQLSIKLSGVDSNPEIIGGSAFNDNYVLPVVSLLLNFIAFELLARLVIFVFALSATKKK